MRAQGFGEQQKLQLKCDSSLEKQSLINLIMSCLDKEYVNRKGQDQLGACKVGSVSLTLSTWERCSLGAPAFWCLERSSVLAQGTQPGKTPLWLSTTFLWSDATLPAHFWSPVANMASTVFCEWEPHASERRSSILVTSKRKVCQVIHL